MKGRGRELARSDLSPGTDLAAAFLHDVVSPDGTRLAAAAGPEGIPIVSLVTGRRQLVRTNTLGKLLSFGWAADGKGLLAQTITNGAREIVHLDFEGKTKVLWKCSSSSDRCFAVPSPDGRQLGIYEQGFSANMWMMENF